MLTERSKVPSEAKKRYFFPAKNPVDARREEGQQSCPTSPAPITQAEKNEVFFFFFGASLLKAQRSPDFGQRKRIIVLSKKSPTLEYVLSSSTEAVSGLGKTNQ